VVYFFTSAFTSGLVSIISNSNIRFAFGGITPPAPASLFPLC